MEQATLSPPATTTTPPTPPGSRLPAHRAGAPLRPRSARLPDPASSAATATSSPSRSRTSARSSTSPTRRWSKRSSPAPPSSSTPVRRTRRCWSRRSGPNSVLTLDDAPHMRQRKLLLPPFHGERIQRYGELIREVTDARDGELAGRRDRSRCVPTRSGSRWR